VAALLTPERFDKTWVGSVVVDKAVRADERDPILNPVLSIAGNTSLGAAVNGADEHGLRGLRMLMLRGSILLLLSTGLVSTTNLLYNIAIARGLGAAGFGHATAIYTLLMLLSAVTLAFQLVCSKFVAKNPELPAKQAIYKDLLVRSWQVGLALGVLLVLSSSAIAKYLNLPSSRDIVLLGAGTAVYIPLGVRRGMLQGLYDFRRLAVNFVLEVLVKFGGTLLLLYYGWGVTGVIASVVASIVVAYAAASPTKNARADLRGGIPASFREGMQAIVFFVGQVIISNLDILLVKHYFPAAVAGLYAAVALVGRVVYMFSWSVVSSMFPVSAASAHRQASRSVLKSALALVTGMTTVFTLAAWLAPASLWKAILGARFLASLQAPFSPLLASYSAMTSIYSIAVVLLTYEMSRRIVNATWVQLGFSALLPLGISLFHNSLQQVIMVQLLLMLGLLLAVSLPFWHEIAFSTEDEYLPLLSGGLTKLRKVSEHEVIAEFLRAEFFQAEFDRYRGQVADIVFDADIGNPHENAVRKALLFRRRGKLWRELPENTQWWEIELQPCDLTRIRAFPRKQWRKFAQGDFYLVRMIERIRSRVESEDHSWFAEKMRSVAADMRGNGVPNSVLLIGEDERSPLTIIEGNHRMAAALLVSPTDVARQFRFYCGLSPEMTNCCWYRTDLKTLSRYAANMVRYVFHDRDYLVQRSLRERANGQFVQ
jgi:O-antigen/teichoic acid export membrane protein